MTKTRAQLDAEIAEALRAKKWQEQVARDERARQERVKKKDPSPEKRYEEYQSDLAAGVFHGEHRGRAADFRLGPITRQVLTKLRDAEGYGAVVKRLKEYSKLEIANWLKAELTKKGLRGADNVRGDETKDLLVEWAADEVNEPR